MIKVREMPALDAADLERFMSHVEQSSACWLWLGVKTTQGTPVGRYGIFGKRVNGKLIRMRAHRASYAMFVGPVGDSLVCHHCDNPSCVRPDHLFLGTAADNIADMGAKKRAKGGPKRVWNRGLTHCQRGHPFSGDNLAIWHTNGKRRRICKTCRKRSPSHNARRHISPQHGEREHEST